MWSEAEKFLSSDKYIGPLIKKYGHCKIKPQTHIDYFQALVSAIVGQQLSGKVADVIYDRLKSKVGGRITYQKILSINDQELRNCGMAWAKVRSIKDLAERVKYNSLKIKRLNQLPDEEVKKELVSVKGIGPWTAEMFLIFTLGRPDVFPEDDLGIKKGFKILVKKDLYKEQMVRFTLRWKPYRTVASWYIWRLLD